MIKDILYYLGQYYAARRFRDIGAVAIFTALAVCVYIFSSKLDMTDSMKLGNTRYAVLGLWVAFCCSYTYFTAFRHYRDPRCSYTEMFYPVAPPAKFAAVCLRSVLIIPILLVAMLWVIDALWQHAVYPDVEARGFVNILAGGSEPLNYLPVYPYYMMWLCSVALLAALSPRIVAIVLMIAALFSLFIFPGFDNSGCLYPFISTRVEYEAQGLHWRSAYSCLRIGTTTGYMLSYLWLVTLPLFMILLSYYRLKEATLS